MSKTMPLNVITDTTITVTHLNSCTLQIKNVVFQFKDILQQCLTYAELGDYLDCDPDVTSKITLLGITHDDLHRLNKYKKVRFVTSVGF